MGNWKTELVSQQTQVDDWNNWIRSIIEKIDEIDEWKDNGKTKMDRCETCEIYIFTQPLCSGSIWHKVNF